MINNVGQYLKNEREAKGIKLEHVAEITKVSLNHLKAIEDGRFEVLPGKVYVKGFIKLYARCIGIDPDALPPVQTAVQPQARPQPAPMAEPRTQTTPAFRPQRRVLPSEPAQKAQPAAKLDIKREALEVGRSLKDVSAKVKGIKISGRVVFAVVAVIIVVLAYLASR